MAEYYFRISQIAEMAMEIETAGARFYDLLASAAQETKLKDIFTALSKAEIEHREIFRRIADKFREESSTEYSIDIESDMKSHITALKEIALTYRTLPEVPTDIAGAIEVGIKTEKEAVRIYTEIRSAVIEKFQDILSEIIKEEESHLKILTKIKDALGTKK